MHRQTRLSTLFLSLSLLAFVNACAERDFKGTTTARTVAKTNDAKPDASKNEPSEPVKDDAVIPEEPATELIPGEEVEVPRIMSKAPNSITHKFPASLTKQDIFSFSLDTKTTSTTFILTDNNGSKTQAHNQITRPLTTDTFTQGSAGDAKRDEFPQVGSKGLVDILVVIDNSGSMDVEQKNLSTKLSSLLTSIQGSDWQIGVITTTVQANDACKMTLINSGEAGAEKKFTDAVNAGITGSGIEAGIKQAVIGLGCAANPWLRNSATTAVLFVTDADNCSNDGADCGSNPWAKEAYLIDYVEKTLKKTLWKNAGFYGIFSLPSAPCKVSENVGTQYQRLMDYKNSGRNNAGDICQANYSATLNQISADIALLLETQFSLKNLPDNNPVKLSIDGVAVPAADYTIAGKTITFKAGKEPATGKVLVADYNINATDRFQDVMLKNDPVLESLVVKVGTTTLTRSDYSLVGRKLTFVKPPADLSKITLDYRVASALDNSYQLEKTPIAGSLKVKVGTEAAVGMSYDAAKNQVILNPPATDGAVVSISYDYRVGPNLTYTVSSIAGSSNHKVYDGATAIPFAKKGDSYTINTANHSLGKVLTLKYDAPNEAIRSFDLPQAPEIGSVVFTKDLASCKLGNGISISANRVSANCAIASKADFEMTYSYSESYDSFAISEVTSPEVGIWEVAVDNLKFDQFTRVGNTIKIDFVKYLKLDSVIEVRYTFPE